MWHVAPVIAAWWVLLVLFAWAVCRSGGLADERIEGWRSTSKDAE